MAEINENDLISDGAIKRPYELEAGFDAATKALLTLINTGKELGVAIKGADNIKTVREETEKLTASQVELQKIEKQIATVQAKNNAEYIKATKALQENKQALKEKTALGEKDARQINAQNSSLKQLKAALEKNRDAYRNLANEEARAGKEGQALKAIIDQQDQAVKKINGDLGDFRDNVGNYEGALKSLKTELKLAKDEMAFLAKTTGTTSPEFIKASAKAGALKDEINDLNDAIKNTSASKFENIGNSLKDVGSKLLALDFDGAAQSARQFAAVSKSLTFKEISAGLQSLGTTLANVGKALLTNPIFIIAGVIAGIALALKYFYDQQEKASQLQIKRYQKEQETLTARYDKEIKLQQIVGKNTFELEKAKQKMIIENADKSIKALGRVHEVDMLGTILNRRLTFQANEDKTKQLEEFIAAKRKAKDELDIIEATQAEFNRKTSADTAKQIKEDLFSLQEFRLKLAIEGEQEIINNEKISQDKRLAAIDRFVILRRKLAQLERDEALSKEGLTAEAILLINLKLQDNLTKAAKDGQAERDKINAEVVKKIEDNAGKAGDKIAAGFKKPVPVTLFASIETGIKKATETATYQTRKFIEDLENGLKDALAIFSDFSTVFGNLLDSITARRLQNIDKEEERLDEQTKKQIKLAGDNDAAIERIEADAEKRKEQLEKKRVAAQRKAAIFDKATAAVQAAILTAVNIVKVFPNPVLMALAAALGAVQVAAILTKPIPQYFRGTSSAEGGPAYVGEQGTELMKKPGHDWELTPSVATLMNVPRGTEIVPHGETMRRLAMGALSQNGGSVQRQATQDPALLQEMQAINKNLEKIRPVRQNLIRNGATLHVAIEDKKGHTKLMRGVNLGKWF